MFILNNEGCIMGKFIRIFLLIFFIFLVAGTILFMYKGVPVTSYTIEKVIDNENL